MNTAAAIYENLVTTMSRESGSRGKAASEAFGDSSQQRFSDVLPLAQAAQEQAPEADVPEEVTGEATSATDEDPVDPASQEDASSQEEETEFTYSQVTGWPFTELVPPVVQSQVQGTVGVVQAADATIDATIRCHDRCHDRRADNRVGGIWHFRRCGRGAADLAGAIGSGNDPCGLDRCSDAADTDRSGGRSAC